jgi:hypothetical protein
MKTIAAALCAVSLSAGAAVVAVAEDKSGHSIQLRDEKCSDGLAVAEMFEASKLIFTGCWFAAKDAIVFDWRENMSGDKTADPVPMWPRVAFKRHNGV